MHIGELPLLRLEVAKAAGPILMLTAARCNAEGSAHVYLPLLFDALNVGESQCEGPR